MLLRILLLCFVGFHVACGPTLAPPLIPKNDYDASLKMQAYRLKEKRKLNARQVQKFGALLEEAQAVDLRAVDSLMQTETSDKWIYINAYHRRIRARQNSVAPVLLKPVSDKAQANWVLVSDIREKEVHSRNAAATYLYDKAQELLGQAVQNGQKSPARQAWQALDNLTQNYYPTWKNSVALTDSAYTLGQTHVLLDIIPASGSDSEQFWGSALQHKDLKTSQWCKVQTDYNLKSAVDFRVSCRLSALQVGGENTWMTTRTETEKVQVGCTEVKDSTGRVISREPIYEERTNTITCWHVSRDASATILAEVYDHASGNLLFSRTFSDQYNYSNQSEASAVSAPSGSSMVSELGYRIARHLKAFIHQDLANR